MIKGYAIIPAIMCCFLFVSATYSESMGKLYNLGIVKIEVPNTYTQGNRIIKFKIYNTSRIPVRYFSVTCKIFKDGYLIDERICNGFGIEARSWKAVNAKFLWLPPEYNIEFEANKIRTERLDLVKKESPSRRIKDPVLLEIDNAFEPERDPMDLLDNEFKVGQKYQLFGDGKWFPDKE